jgi:hypothetical protein
MAVSDAVVLVVALWYWGFSGSCVGDGGLSDRRFRWIWRC